MSADVFYLFLGSSNFALLSWTSDNFKTNEKKIMSELDEIVKKANKGKKGKKGGDMKGAVEGTEEIR